MHVLGHSFSQRRKTPKPRDLHIRKVSFSGSSLSSGCSLSSSSSAASTSTARAPASSRSPGACFDPLSLHPTFHAPPRLHDRPLLSPERRQRFEAEATFFDDDDDSDDDYFVGVGEYRHQGKEELPPHTSPMDHADHDRTEPQDYFFQHILKRPQLPRSRWSESTVHTLEQLEQLEQLTPAASITTPEGDGNDCGGEAYTFRQPGHQSMPNFSHKRETVLPKRPPMKTLDSLDEFIKRGGWKRRGIVFNEEDIGGDEGAL